MTPYQKRYLETVPPFVLRDNLREGIYSDEFAEHVRRVLDRHDMIHETGAYDPLLKPESADELRLRD